MTTKIVSMKTDIKIEFYGKYCSSGCNMYRKYKNVIQCVLDNLKYTALDSATYDDYNRTKHCITKFGLE